MIGALLALVLQVSAEPAAAPPEAPAAQTEASAANAIPDGMMDCQYNRGTRIYNCTNSEGEVLRCRRERQLGSRFRTLVCLTHAEDQQIQRDTHSAIDRQQRIATPGGG